MSESPKLRFCFECGAGLPEVAKFCPSCGVSFSGLDRRLVSRPVVKLGLRGVLLIALLTAVAVGFGWSTQYRLGQRPTVTFEEMRSKTETQWNDSELDALRAKVKAAPDDKTALTDLATALFDKVRSQQQPPSGLVFDTIDVLREILRVDPGNGFALLALGDISFNQQVFSKALEYYEQYVKLFPDNLDAKARYASALSFNGKTDQAEQVLNEILKKDPKNFHAQAYLAITYAQKGNMQEAITLGQKALESAPSQEARERFAGFLDSLNQETNQGGSKETSLPHPVNERSGEAKNGLPGVEAYIRSNPVAGPKFVRAELTPEGALKLYFSQFPMQQMPPFIREKFVGGVKEKVAQALANNASMIHFLDADTGEDLLAEKP